MKLWGVVAEVDEKDLVVSLPGGLRGLVRASDALDPILDGGMKVVLIDFYVYDFMCYLCGLFVSVGR